ncbi:MAG: transcription-repair coupling factor, partial [Spirochaetales bacterium]|nr:transcription-repair coupling factor [Spirochaetales bacterium]
MKDIINNITSKIETLPEFKAFFSKIAHRKYPIYVDSLEGSYLLIVLSAVKKKYKEPFILIFTSEREALESAAFLKELGCNAEYFPSFETFPYSADQPSYSVLGQRVRLFKDILSGNLDIITASASNYVTPLVDPSHLRENLMTLRVGQAIDIKKIEKYLSSIGFMRVPRVSVEGEFAVRGEVLDIFLVGADKACRVFFAWDEIEKIRYFDAVSQVSESDVDSVDIYPVKEDLWNDQLIQQLKSYFKGHPSLDKDSGKTIEDLENNYDCLNSRMLLPLCFDRKFFLKDYFEVDPVVILTDQQMIEINLNNFKKDLTQFYIESRRNKILGPYPDDYISDFQHLLATQRQIAFKPIDNIPADELIKFDYIAPSSFFGNLDYFVDELKILLENRYSVFICCDSNQQLTRLSNILNEYEVEFFIGNFSEGFTLPRLKIAVMTEKEILGRRKHRAVSLKKVKSVPIDSFLELEVGDYVVHINYGIGIYRGLERIKAANKERDYLKLEYSSKEVIFIPVEQVNFVQKYIGNEGNPPRLDTIGSKSWENRKSAARRSVEDLADMLLEIYSKRQLARGYAFSRDTDWQVEFELRFPYEETEDQLQCIEEIKRDMESPRPMDRLICGDVGFGKTEIAMRAIFKAVMTGKQVALLAPTTILVEQHYERFVERFEGFPVKIVMLSRFVSASRVSSIKKMILAGEVDVVIGTHKLLSPDIKFKDLGLLVIDEEQRFGVKAKEKLKGLKASIDCLSMSATPIPRTLHMSLLKIRDMSILKTAPYNRQAIETHVLEYDEKLIAEAVRKEVARGGQVFFLHNRVETLDNIVSFLQRLLPEILIESAHGRMGATELEDIMHRFVHNGFQVLVATTIIESGIDIPNVNTIIIDRADMYGISQLYQLRGRVGRSSKKSYAYLFYPDRKAISEVAMKRLRIINDFSELGSGFKVAMKDMEVRGAGNLLGREQHGEIVSVGFDMYMKLLHDAVLLKESKLKGTEAEIEEDVYMELDYSGYIPEGFIPDVSERMAVYKEIASVMDYSDLESIITSLNDRYGHIPKEVSSFLSLAELKIICKKLYIVSIKERSSIIYVEFGKIGKID